MTVLDDVLARVTPVTRREEICIDGELAARIDDLERQMLTEAEQDIRENRTPRAPRVAREIEQLQQAQRDSMQVFEVRSIGGTEWRRLRGNYPPTKKQRAEGWDVDPDEFRPAAVAACCALVAAAGTDAERLEHLDAEGTKRLAAVLSDGQWARLWKLVLWCNTEGDARPKSGIATGILAASGSESTTPAPTESP